MTSEETVDVEYVARVIQRGVRNMHARMRKLIAGMDEQGLNWKPDPEASSIAVLITHTLGSEREMLAAVRAVKIPRDRPSEFLAHADGAQLEASIDQADLWLEEYTGAFTADDLTESRPRGEDGPQPGVVWLVTNYGHSREHLAQMELTKQLYAARR